MTGEAATDRRVHAITGADRILFLQGLITTDARHLDKGPLYAALLTPQGKYLADFLLVTQGDTVLLDIHESLSEATVRRLMMYRLRADVQIAPTALQVTRGLGPAPAGSVADPRHPALGWRHYGDTPGTAPVIDWDAIRVAHCIPETGIELIPNETYILEAGFEALNGVDFRKGCYVGQEVTARMKHKTELRKGLVQVGIAGTAPVGAEIMAGDKPAGQVFTQSGGRAIAWLRFDRSTGPMTAGEATITWPVDG
jgi:folate-binding protein YgfZ